MARRSTKMHYAGGLRVRNARGRLWLISPGFAACCSGGKARAIRANGNHTLDLAAVTCRACQALLLKAAEGAARETER